MSPTGDSAQRTESDLRPLPAVLVWHPEAEAYRRALAPLLPGVRVEVVESRRPPEVPGAEPILLTWRPPPGAFKQLPSLQWIQATGAGVDHLLARDDLPRGVALTRSLGRFGIQAAEFVTGYLLFLLLEIEAYRRDQDRAVWQPRPRRLLADLTVGVLGLGALGGAIADRLGSLGADVLGACRRPRPARGVRRVYAGDDWSAMLPGCDALVLAAPLTPETRGMVDGTALGRLPEGAILVNVGRGALVDEAALLEALRSGRLGAAVLDAFAVEPLPPDSPLWTEPSAWITPHVAAPSEVEPIAQEFADNYRRFVDGSELENRVDVDRGY